MRSPILRHCNRASNKPRTSRFITTFAALAFILISGLIAYGVAGHFRHQEETASAKQDADTARIAQQLYSTAHVVAVGRYGK